jgi:hypothetical protein
VAAKFERSRVMTCDTCCITPVAPSSSMHVAFLLHFCCHTHGSVHGYVTSPPSGGCVETSETQGGPPPKLSLEPDERESFAFVRYTLGTRIHHIPPVEAE